MSLSVHLLQAFDDEFISDLKARLGADIILSSGEQLPAPAEFEILISGRPRREWLTASSKLKALIIPWAGLPESTRKLMNEFPSIDVHNLHHNSVPTAEHALALMFAVARRIVRSDASLRQGDWTPRYDSEEPILLEGKTALVLGFGAIGRRIGSVCRALGMRVIAVRRSSFSESADDIEVRTVSELPSLLPRAQVIFIALPLTPETEGLMTARELELLPEGALLINIARGKIVDEAALYDVLRRGRIHAGLDVWYRYPTSPETRTSTLPSLYPFHELGNVTLSPHLGGDSDETERIRAAGLAAMLNAAATGLPIPNRVNPQNGY